MTTPIYLDHNATTPLAPEVLEAMLHGALTARLQKRRDDLPAAWRLPSSACHSEHDAVSGVLAAMGVDAPRAAGAVRLSVGRSTTAEEVARAADAMVAAWQRMTTR